MATSTDPSLEERFLLNKAKWRSRRGTLELDLILPTFVDKYFLKLPMNKRLLYLALLEEDDWDILDWLQKPMSVPKKYAYLIDQLNDFQEEKRS